MTTKFEQILFLWSSRFETYNQLTLIGLEGRYFMTLAAQYIYKSYILESSILNLHKFRLHAVFPCINMYVHVHDNVASAIILELKSSVIAKKNKESKLRTPAYYS